MLKNAIVRLITCSDADNFRVFRNSDAENVHLILIISNQNEMERDTQLRISKTPKIKLIP